MMLAQPVQLSLIRVIRLLPPFSVPRHLSTNRTPYPLQYEMIVNHPPPPRQRPAPRSSTEDSSSPASFEDFLDDRLKNPHQKLGKAERKYLNKRRRRLLGTDSEDEEYRRAHQDELVELQPEIVRFKSLYEREEELFFYDQCAFPWDENKHYRMTYQLEKKYFPNKGFDKAFLDPGMENKEEDQSKTMSSKGSVEEGTVFFQNHNWVKSDDEELTVDALEKKVDDVFKRLKKFPDHDAKADVAEKKQGVNAHLSEKKVGDFFKELRRGPIEDDDDDEPKAFLSSRRTGLPAKWDTPQGTVLLVNKPKGWTSFTVCGKLRRLVNVKKVGHAGTLDPMATGLLIVCVGKSTKIVDRFQGMVKGYSGIFRLGEATSTWDADSPVIQREPWEHIKDADLKKVIDTFSGEIWQVPPMFSAIKVGGEKLYEKARRGENIELSPRRISIFQFDLERSLDDRQNLIFRVTCSKGTYIRSLCADLGKALGSCAHLTALRRDSIGEYLADDAWDFKELEEEITKGYI